MTAQLDKSEPPPRRLTSDRRTLARPILPLVRPGRISLKAHRYDLWL